MRNTKAKLDASSPSPGKQTKRTRKPLGASSLVRKEHPVGAAIRAIAASVPAEAWRDVPTDLSYNLDHYLYGAPKR